MSNCQLPGCRCLGNRPQVGARVSIDDGFPRRVLLALGVASAAGLLVWYYYQWYAPGLWSDFDQVWLGSRALLAGEDPYAEVATHFPWPLYYPLPTLLVGVPFAAWSLPSARIVFAIVTAGLASWAILRYFRHAWPLLLSAPFAYAVARGQWSPALVAAVMIPWLGGLAVVKPSIGLATFAARPARQAMVGGALLVLLSFLVRPTWAREWLHAIQVSPHLVQPVLAPGGLILLAALGRWREPGGRLLAVLACVPQTPSIYELFPMALATKTLRQALIMGLSWNVLYLVTHAAHAPPPLTMLELTERPNLVYWPVYLVLGYVPALLAVLSPSPLACRPHDFAMWPMWRQRVYRIGWSAVLSLVCLVPLLWAFLIWRGAGSHGRRGRDSGSILRCEINPAAVQASPEHLGLEPDQRARWWGDVDRLRRRCASGEAPIAPSGTGPLCIALPGRR